MERDDVLSAIRLIDVFFISVELADPPPEIIPGEPPPVNMPLLTVFAIANIKADPGYAGYHKVEIRMQNTAGEMKTIGSPTEMAFTAKIPEAPTAIGLMVQINLLVRKFGVCYVCFYLDDEEVARSPITLVSAIPQ